MQKSVDSQYKKYQRPASSFRSLLNDLSRFSLQHLNHEDAKKLLIAAGVDNIDRVHWGSSFDAMLAAIPAQILRLPFRYLIPVIGAEIPVTNALSCGAMSDPEIKGLSNALQQSALGANRTVMRAITKPAADFGFFGKGVAPGSGEPDHSALMAQCSKCLADLEAILKSRIDRSGAPTNDRPATDEMLRALSDQLTAQLLEQLKNNREFQEVMAIDDRIQMLAVMTLATISVQMVARIGVGAALASVGLMPLAKLIAPIIAPLMAPLTKATMNWQDTKSVARAVLRKYRQLEEKFGVVPESGLVELGEFAQDHFGSSAQAKYSRRVKNVFAPTLRKLGIDLSKAQYKLSEQEALEKACNQDQYDKSQEILRHQRALNAVDRAFSPKNYLPNAQVAVDRLIGFAQMDRDSLSDAEFDRLIDRNAKEILAVAASPDKGDADRLAKLLQVDAARFKRTELRELGTLYGREEVRLIDAAIVHAPKIVSGFTVVAMTRSSGTYIHIDEDLTYLQTNLQILKERRHYQRKIDKATNELAVMSANADANVLPSFAASHDDLKKKTEQARAAHASAEKNYWRYTDDIQHYQTGNIQLIDARGKLARQIRDNTWGIRVTMSNLFKEDLWQACRARFSKDIGMPFGEVLAFEAIRTSVVKPTASTALRHKTPSAVPHDTPEARLGRRKRMTDHSPQRIDEYKKTRVPLILKREQIEARKPDISGLQSKVDAAKGGVTDLIAMRDEFSALKPWHWKKIIELNVQIKLHQADEKASQAPIDEYIGWLAEEATLKAVDDIAFAALSPLEGFSVRLSDLCPSEGAAYSLTDLTEMADRLEALPEVDRYKAFEMLVDAKTESADRTAVLAMLSSKVVSVRMSDRWFAVNYLVHQLKTLDSASKKPVLDLLSWTFSDLAFGRRKDLLHTLLDAGTLDAPALKSHLINLTGELWNIDEPERLASLRSLVKAASRLPDKEKSEFLTRACSTVGMLPRAERLTAFNEALKEVNTLPVAHKAEPMEVLIQQLHDLPKDSQIQAFDSILGSIRTVKHVVVTITTDAWVEKGIKGMPPINHPAKTRFETRKQVDYPKRSDGGCTLNTLLMESTSLHESNRLAAFDKSLSAACESSGQEAINAFASAASQIATLQDADSHVAFSKMMSHADSMGKEDRIDFFARNLSHFPPEYRLSIFEKAGDVGRTLFWQYRVDVAHSLVLQMDFLRAQDLLPAFRKVLELLARFTSDQLRELDTAELLMDLNLGVRRASKADLALMNSDFSDYLTRAGFFQFDADRGFADVKNKSDSDYAWDALMLFQATGEFALMFVAPSLARSSMQSRGPYKYFANLAGDVRNRFKNTVSRHFSSLLATRSPHRTVAATPDSRTVFVRQVFKGAKFPSDDLVMTKTPSESRTTLSPSESSLSKPGSNARLSVVSNPDTEVKPILAENIPRYIARGDSRPPEVILATGFAPRGTDESMSRHLGGGSGQSAFVSFTRDLERGKFYSQGSGNGGEKQARGYRYILKCPDKLSPTYSNWFDVHYAYPGTKRNAEIAIKGHVPAEWIAQIDVIEVHPTDPDKFRVVETLRPRSRPGISSGLT